MDMIAVREFKYGGKRMKSGEKFATRGKQDARLLKAIGHATEAPEPEPIPVVVNASPKRAESEKGAEAVPIAKVVAPVESNEDSKTKGTYRRRDLTAE